MSIGLLAHLARLPVTPERILRRRERIKARENAKARQEIIGQQTFTEGGNVLRPARMQDFVGQPALKDRLTTAIESVKSREATLAPTLLLGPPGCGKTTLAAIIANQLEVPLHSFIMPVAQRTLLVTIQNENIVLFLDELHRGSTKEQEALLPLLEDGYMQDGRGRRIYADHVHIIGATTEADKLIRPLWDRFRLRPPFEEYDDMDMGRIVLRMAYIEGLDEATFPWAFEIGKATLGMPRYAESLVEAARDLLAVNGTFPTPEEVLATARTTDTGLTADHVRYMQMLHMAGGSAGLDLLKQLLGMPPRYIETLETDLIKQHLIERERSGRELTQKGINLVRSLRRQADESD